MAAGPSRGKTMKALSSLTFNLEVCSPADIKTIPKFLGSSIIILVINL